VQLRDEAAHLRHLERGEARLAQQREQRLQVGAVDLERARREAPLVRERAEVVADRVAVRVRGAISPDAGRVPYRRAASAAATSSPMRRR
jgi:hypothetical protein